MARTGKGKTPRAPPMSRSQAQSTTQASSSIPSAEYFNMNAMPESNFRSSHDGKWTHMLVTKVNYDRMQAKLRIDNDALKKQNKKTRTQNKDLQTENGILQDKIKEANTELEVLHEAKNALQAQLDTLKVELTASNTARESALAALASLTNANGALNLQLYMAQNETRALAQRMDTVLKLQDRDEQYKSGVYRAQYELPIVQADSGSVGNKLLEAAQAQADIAAREKIAEVMTACCASQTDAEKRSEEREKMRKQVEQGLDSLEEMLNAAVEGEEQIVDMQGQVKEAEELRDQAGKEVEGRQEMLDAADVREKRLPESDGTLKESVDQAGAVQEDVCTVVDNQESAGQIQEDIVMNRVDEEYEE